MNLVSMHFLKSKIKEYLSKEDTPISATEKLFNLSPNVLYRLLYDGKYPSVENLIKIADGLNCSIDELLGRDVSIKNIHINLNKTPYKQELLRSICAHVFFLLETNQIKIPKDISLEKIVGAIEVIYKISIKNGDVVANPKTTEAVLTNIFSLSKK